MKLTQLGPKKFVTGTSYSTYLWDRAEVFDLIDETFHRGDNAEICLLGNYAELQLRELQFGDGR